MTTQQLDKELKELKEFMQNYFEKLGKEVQLDAEVSKKSIQNFFNVVERYSKDYQVRFLTQLKNVSTE
jgi:ferredoxin-thioredoxin reductase catalytic subunit